MNKERNSFIAVILCGISFLILLILTILKAIFIVHISPEDEFSTLKYTGITSVLTFGLFLVLLILCRPLLLRLSETVLFVSFALCYCIAGLYWIVHTVYVPEGDPALILNYTKLVLEQGDLSGLSPDRYLGLYPYLMGFLNYQGILWSLCSNERFLFICNLSWSILINLILWRISALIFPKQPLCRKVGILFSFCFFPLFFLMFFLYGTIPGLGFSVLSFWCILHIEEDNSRFKRVFFSVGALITITLAVLIKPDYLIFAIALTIFLFLRYLRVRDRHCLLLLGMILFFSFSAQPLLLGYYRAKTEFPIQGIPMEAEIATGLQEHPRSYLRAGRYNGYEYDIYEQANYDHDIAAQIARTEIVERLRFHFSDPPEAIWFFVRKLLSTWCEPTFESIVTGPSEASESKIDSIIMGSLYEGDWVFIIYEHFMNAFLFLVYALTLLTVLRSLFRNKPILETQVFPCIYLTGGFLYHLAGETKSLCSFMYIVMLLPIAAGKAAHLMEYTSKALQKTETTNNPKYISKS